MKKYAIFILFSVAGTTAFAQYTNTSRVLDGSGTRASGGSYTNLSAAGQPGGISESSGGGYFNQAGFLNTFFLKPNLDTDGDGVPDEADWDNDSDGLADATEIAGSAFSPVTPTGVNAADSDGDGVSDGEESVAGTNPQDADALLKIAAVTNAAGGRSVTWIARSNRTYTVRYALSPAQPVTNVLTTVTATGPASAPWYATEQTVADAVSTNTRVYAVQVLP